jgi:hypothetical protein
VVTPSWSYLASFDPRGLVPFIIPAVKPFDTQIHRKKFLNKKIALDRKQPWFLSIYCCPRFTDAAWSDFELDDFSEVMFTDYIVRERLEAYRICFVDWLSQICLDNNE